jgi:hypothetical protein
MRMPMIDSPVLLGRLAENERCKLCAPLKITPVVVPDFWVDCCNWCKRVKHSMHHKKGSLRRVRFSIYFFSPYGEKDGTRSKNRFRVPGVLFFFLWQKANRFVQPRGVTHSKKMWSWCARILHSFPYDQLWLDHNGGLSRKKWLQVFLGDIPFPAPLTVNAPFNGNGNQPSLGKPIVEGPDSLLSEVLQKRHE